jgi:hypothetical protein
MLGSKFDIKQNGNILIVKNITDSFFNNCIFNVKNIFDHSVVFENVNFNPQELKEFILIPNNFIDEWLYELLDVRIYANNKIIYNKTLNDKSRCYVLYSNSNFESLIEQLIIGLNTYSTVDILHYTINYDSTLDYPNLSNIKYNISGDIEEQQYVQFIKPKIFIDVINNDYDFAVFLDADIQVRPNIDDLFSYTKYCSNGPVFQKAAWDFTLENGNYIPGPLLSNFMQLPTQKFPQGVTNTMIFGKHHKELFEEWDSICFSKEIEEIRKTEFLHDELILNCLQWKKNIKPKQYNFFVNVRSMEDIHFFYNHKNETDRYNMNDCGFGWPNQSFLPYDKNNTKGFHYVKDASIALQINEYVFNNDNLRL